MSRKDAIDRLVSEAERVLCKGDEASMDELLDMIKRINPTPQLDLPMNEKDRLYNYKTMLQNQLLANYGALFKLEKTNWDEGLALIRYRYPPFFDACHIKTRSLSHKAIQQLEKGLLVKDDDLKGEMSKTAKLQDAKVDNVSKLQRAIDEIKRYNYDSARVIFESITEQEIAHNRELFEAANLLIFELGDYQTAIRLLQTSKVTPNQPELMQLLATAHWFSNDLSKARSLYEACAFYALSKDSLYRYAYILFREGELQDAYRIVQQAEQREGFVEGLDSLRQKLKTALKDELYLHKRQAMTAFEANDFESAREIVRRALAISPNDRELLTLSELLKEL